MAETLDQVLGGAEVASVEFVRDYVQLHLELPGETIHLSAYSDPVVDIAGESHRRGTPGWRDALCALVDRRVVRSEIIEEIALRLAFDDGAILSVPLDDESRVGPEAVCITGNNTFWVW